MVLHREEWEYSVLSHPPLSILFFVEDIEAFRGAVEPLPLCSPAVLISAQSFSSAMDFLGAHGPVVEWAGRSDGMVRGVRGTGLEEGGET